MVFKIEQVLIDHISNEVPGSHGCTIQGGKEVQNANGFLKIQWKNITLWNISISILLHIFFTDTTIHLVLWKTAVNISFYSSCTTLLNLNHNVMWNKTNCTSVNGNQWWNTSILNEYMNELACIQDRDDHRTFPYETYTVENSAWNQK